jgi:tetratricopeptide (TPR) repeat protein
VLSTTSSNKPQAPCIGSQDEGADALLDVARPRFALGRRAVGRCALRSAQRWTDAETLLLRFEAATGELGTWFQLRRAVQPWRSASAIAAYESSLTHNPNARNTRLNLAVLYARNGDESAALQLYDELLRAHPRYTPALLNRALVHERAGRASAEIADLELALRVAGDGADIRARLARLLLREGQNDRAQLAVDAVAESPSDPGCGCCWPGRLRGRRGSAVKG